MAQVELPGHVPGRASFSKNPKRQDHRRLLSDLPLTFKGQASSSKGSGGVSPDTSLRGHLKESRHIHCRTSVYNREGFSAALHGKSCSAQVQVLCSCHRPHAWSKCVYPSNKEHATEARLSVVAA